jgi:N-acetylmuramoyl-L-alanine amidase
MRSVFSICMLLIMLQSSAQTGSQNYIPARSAGKIPAILYGLGEDRLGGAKMGYVDTNVLFRVIDSVDNKYRVQLSKYHTAYVEKQYLRFDSLPEEKPFYLTGNIRAEGYEDGDSILINIDGKLPYRSYMEINPSRIVVDIFGVQSNTNWITQLQSLKEVKNLYYNQIEDDVLRLTIELKHVQHWGYSISYITDKKLAIRIKRRPAKTVINNLKIAIDAGHGGTNVGAAGRRTHASEKALTLKFSKALEKYLKQKGVKNIVLTRNKDTTFENKDRISFLQEEDPDLVISFHLNSSGNPETKGVSTYYKHIGFRPVSVAVLKRMLSLKLEDWGNTGSFNFFLSQPTDFVNCLLEVAFLSNRSDEKKIVSSAFQAAVAQKVYLGIVDWLKNANKPS